MSADSLGRVTASTPCTGYISHSILLSRPVPIFEPESAPDCLFITKSLYAVNRWDYLRLEGSITLPALQHLGVRFLDRPVAEWLGYGRLRKKKVQELEIMVEEEVDVNWGRFADLVKMGVAYKGASKKRRRKKK